MADFVDLGGADDGHLFKVRVLNTGEERIARYHHTAIGKVPLRFHALRIRSGLTTTDAGSTVAGAQCLSAECATAERSSGPLFATNRL
jgi:hypothetical protein